MKILFKRKSNTFSIEPNKLTNYLQIENSINNIFFPGWYFCTDTYTPTLVHDGLCVDVVLKNIRRIWLIAKPLPGEYSTTEILPVWTSVVQCGERYRICYSRVWSILLATLTLHTEHSIFTGWVRYCTNGRQNKYILYIIFYRGNQK